MKKIMDGFVLYAYCMYTHVAKSMAAVLRQGIHSTWWLLSVRLGVSALSSEANKMDTNIDGFVGKPDHHLGVHVDSTKETCKTENFVSHLQVSLQKWRNDNMKTIWFKVDRKNSDWIPHLVNEGFYFHHARNDFVTLYQTLDPEQEVPPYAHTNLGVGAFVLNEETNEVLVIKEKHSHLPINRWKLPGGYVEPGENIPEAVQRELLEETGIIGKFKSLIGFRHAHNYAFGCSDIYMVARLTPETFEIKKSDREIAECVWMKLEEYAINPEVHKQNRLIAKKMIEYLKKNLEVSLVHAQRPNSTEPVWIYVINDGKDPTPFEI